jgi:hypothetical protein
MVSPLSYNKVPTARSIAQRPKTMEKSFHILDV